MGEFAQPTAGGHRMAGSPDLDTIGTAHPSPGAGFAALGRAILAIGRPAFAAAMQDAMRECLAIEEATVLAFPDSGAPRPLFSSTCRSDGATKALLRKYAEQYYRDDIDVRSIMAWTDPERVLTVHRTAGEFTRLYRRVFFDNMRMADKLLVVKIIDGLRVVLNIYGKQTAYTADHIAKVEQLAPVILATIVRDHRLRHDAPMEATADIDATVRRLQLDRSVGFTRREAQVCAKIMEGRSTTAIALDLGIAPSSVITFRKSLYRKLGIVSQAELFSLALAAWAAPPEDGATDADAGLRQTTG